MALTAYCKKCGREVEPGEVCSRCGSRLGKNAAHAAWCVERTPVKDWMCWNRVMRLLLPGMLVLAAAVLLLEGFSGGIPAVERLLASGFLTVLGILLGTVVLLVFLVLLFQGKELTDYVVDSRGVHETRYLPDPTPLKLLARMKSPAQAQAAEGSGTVPVLKLGTTDLAWKDVARVQLWAEKCMILFYAPAWWLRVPVCCTPFSWDDVIGLIREKLGKKKKLKLPAGILLSGREAGIGAANPFPAGGYDRTDGNAEETPGQISMAELMAEAPAGSGEPDAEGPSGIADVPEETDGSAGMA